MARSSDRARTYREDGERRWERLAADMVVSGQVAPEQLDLDVDSLRVVWEYVLPRLRRRSPDEPVDPRRQPPWWDGPRWQRYAGWDDATHDLVGAVAYYFGEVAARRPGAAWSVGQVESNDPGEPVVVCQGVDINPLGMVMHALADVWDGHADPDALVELALHRPEPLSRELLYPTRLVLRLRGRPAGVLRRSVGLNPVRVVSGLTPLLAGDAPNLASEGMNAHEHVGSGDWRALVGVDLARGVVREVRAIIGATYSDPPPSPLAREQVRSFVDGLVALAAALHARVDILHAQPNDLHAPRPSGALTADRVPEVLDTVDLGQRRRRRR